MSKKSMTSFSGLRALKTSIISDGLFSDQGKRFVKSFIKKKEKIHLENKDVALDQVKSLDLLLNDINKKPDTFVFELIQNADDYPNPNQDNTAIKFTITKDHLVLSHNGLEFTETNVKAISSVGSDDKKDKEDKIGFKGMGFKSIFKFSNHVWIKSGIFSFKFDENYYKKKRLFNGDKNLKYSEHRVPWQILPIWTAPIVGLEEREKNLLKNPVCIFIRPNGEDTKDRIKKLFEIETMFLETFKNEDRILLFLRNVKKLEFEGKRDNFITTLNENNWSISNLKQLEIPTRIRDEINEKSKSDVRIPEKYGMISSTQITFAAKKDEETIQKTENSKIFAYLPTNWNLGFDFLLNGNFIPDGSREELFDDIEWNLYLMEEAGRLFIQWISSMVTELENSSPYKILPDLNSIISHENNDKKLKFLERFKVGMQNGILETPFVLDSNKKLSLLDKIIIDKTGISNIIGESVFKEQFKITKKILQKDIKNKSWFVKHLEGTNGGIFEWDTLKEKITELTSILKDPSTNVKFINFLIEAERMDYFKDVEFVLTANGDLERPSNVYINVSEDDLLFVNKLDIKQLNTKVKEGLSGNYEYYFNNYDGYQFIKKQIISKIDCINEMITTIEESKELFNHLFKYLNHFYPNDLNSLKSLNIYNQEQEVINFEVDSYIYNQALQKLIDNNCFPYNHFQVVSNQYPEATYTLLQKLNVRMYQPVEFIQHEICQYVDKINEHLNPLDADIKLKATQHLIELIITHKPEFSENVTKDIFNSYKELKVVTKDNEFNPVSRCFLSNEYTGNKEIEVLMEDFPEKSISFISPSYLKSSIDKREWKKTLQDLKCSDDHLSFIKKEVLKRLQELDENNIISATQLIFKYQNKLENELTSLNYFPVLTNSGIIDIYEDDVYLGKEYYIGLDSDIENLIKNCLSDNIVSNKYTLKEYEDWKKFWILIRACDEQKNYEIIEDCFKYLIDNDNTIDIKFDSILSWMKAHSNLSESYLPTYIQKNLVTPNLNNKFCYSHELFDHSLKDVIQNNNVVCSIDLSDDTQIIDVLGLKKELDIETYVLILKREESINWLDKNDILRNIHELTQQNEIFPEDFIANGKVMNQRREWVNISELYSIEEEFSEKLGVKKNQFVIHEDFNKLSSALEIEELIENDFDFCPIEKQENDSFKNILLERARYIALIKDPKSYKDTEQQLIDKIKPIIVNKCKRLSWQYNNKIKKNDFPFWGDIDELIIYYTGDWKHVTAADMFKWIFDLFNLSGEAIKRSFDRILLANDTEEIIEYLLEEGYEIPNEWKLEEEVKEEEEDVRQSTEQIQEEVVNRKTDNREDVVDIENEEHEVKNTEAYKVNYSESEIAYLESVITGEIDFGKSDQFDINRNAIFRSILFLRDEGYSILESTLENFMDDNVKQFKHEDGGVTNFIIRSAVKGVLFLDPSSWEKLNKEDVSLLIYEGGEKVTRKNTRKSLIEDYTDFNKFGLVRVGEDFDFGVNDFDNLLFERDDEFDDNKYDKYKLLFLLKENQHTQTFIDIFKEDGGENDSK